MITEGPEYDDETEGMRAALEKAREGAHSSPTDLDAMLEKMKETWDAPATEEEQPSKAAGDQNSLRNVADQSGVDRKETPMPEQTAPLPPHLAPWADISTGLRDNMTRSPPPSPIEAKMKSVGWSPTEKVDRGGESPSDWSQLNEKLATPPPAPVAPTPVPQVDPALEELHKNVQAHDAAEKTKAEEARTKAEAEQAAAAAAAAKNVKPEPDWSSLLGKVQDAERNADTLRTVNGALHAVAPGFEGDPRAGQGGVESAKAAVEMERQKRADASRLLEEHRKAALGDPKSPESARARDAFAQQFPEQAKIMHLEGLSANEIAPLAQKEVYVEHYRASLAADKAKEAEKEAAAKAKQLEVEKEATTKKEAAEKKLSDENASLEQRRPIMASDPRAKELGFSADAISKMGKADLDQLQIEMESLSKRKPHGTGAPAKEIHTMEDVAPMDRAPVQRIIDGLDDSSKYGRTEGPRLAKIAAKLSGGYDSTRHGVYADIAKKTAEDPQIQSAKTMKKHFADALENLPDNFDAPAANRIKNFMVHGTGSDKMTKFETAVALGAGEMAKGIGENAEGGKELVRQLLEENQSPQQLKTRLLSLVKLQEDALETKRERFLSAAPKGTQLPDILRREQAAPGGMPPPTDAADPVVTLTAEDGHSKKRVKKSAADAYVKAHPKGSISE